MIFKLHIFFSDNVCFYNCYSFAFIQHKDKPYSTVLGDSICQQQLCVVIILCCLCPLNLALLMSLIPLHRGMLPYAIRSFDEQTAT